MSWPEPARRHAVKATIEHDSLGQAQTQPYSTGGGFSLFTPFVEGAALEASLAWTDGVHRLSINWPAGARRPSVLGELEPLSSGR